MYVEIQKECKSVTSQARSGMRKNVDKPNNASDSQYTGAPLVNTGQYRVIPRAGDWAGDPGRLRLAGAYNALRSVPTLGNGLTRSPSMAWTKPEFTVVAVTMEVTAYAATK